MNPMNLAPPVWREHEEPRYVKAHLSKERKDADFMAEQREAVRLKEIRTLSSMENTPLKLKRMKKEDTEGF